MPRQSRGPARSAPSRPTPQSRPSPQQPPQARQASTVARPTAPAQAPPAQAQQGKSPGLFGQMASTAAGVAVGSSIGHMVGGLFGGSSSQETSAPADQPLAQQENGAYTANQNYTAPQACVNDVNNFRNCMDQNQGNLTICGWYLDQLKACQQAASQY